eukprot:GHVU01182186.1.p1 GENE.GHVU01182186.1~~GHVU01182186.1.p1  ORF type:complete len:194 (-),score=1.69 GHVU01182186.1:979-1560(-)
MPGDSAAWRWDPFVHTHMRTCAHTHTHTYMRSHTHTHIRTCAVIHTHIRTCAVIHTRTAAATLRILHIHREGSCTPYRPYIEGVVGAGAASYTFRYLLSSSPIYLSVCSPPICSSSYYAIYTIRPRVPRERKRTGLAQPSPAHLPTDSLTRVRHHQTESHQSSDDDTTTIVTSQRAETQQQLLTPERSGLARL